MKRTAGAAGLVICISILAIGLHACQRRAALQMHYGAAPDPSPAAADAVPQVADAGRHFAVDLYRQLAASPGNIAVSPHSIDMVMRMVWAGAAGDSSTQLATALHLDATQPALAHEAADALVRNLTALSDSYELRSANGLFIAPGTTLAEDYIDIAAGRYHAGLATVDFTTPTPAANAINDWIARQTNHRITDLVQPSDLPIATALVLANAVYLNADWREPFDRDHTHPDPFTTADARSVTVPTMHQTGYFPYHATADAQVLIMPYRGQTMSMMFILPHASVDLAAFEKSLTADKLSAWRTAAQPNTVIVALPKYEFRQRISLVDTLKAMGITDVFEPAKADLSGMTGRRELYIAAVAHETYLRVDEEGTEAAAATVAAAAAEAMSDPQQIRFIANRPFLFALHHDPTGAILFMGRVSDPTAK